MSTYTGAEISNKGMVLYLDAANKKSYPGTGSTFYDLSGNGNNASIANSPTFTYERGGCFTFDNINTLFSISNNLNLETLGVTRYYTVMFGVQKKFYGTGGNNFGDSSILLASTTGYTEGWRIIESSSGTPGAAFTGTATYQFGTPGASSTLYITDPVANRFSICAFTVNNTVATGFINGITGTPATFSSYVAGTRQGTIGQQGFGVGSFAGLFGFMMIYNRALSSGEIYNNYLMLKELRGL